MGNDESSHGGASIIVFLALVVLIIIGFLLFRKKRKVSAKIKGPGGIGAEFEASDEREQVEESPSREGVLCKLDAHFVYREEDFFELLETYASSACQRVDLTYFDNRPPEEVRTHRGKEYYNNLVGIIRKKPSVHFRRIVRANFAILPWVRSQINELKGQNNFSLACYRDISPTDPEIDAITVQLIDGEFTFLVSLGTQKSSRTPRDIVVCSSIFNAMWTRYYDMLWRRSVVVIERGAICDSWEQLNHSLQTS